MRSGPLLAVVLLVLLAGCSQRPPASPEAPAADAPATIADVVVTPLGGTNTTPAAATSYLFDLANLTYADQLVRHTITLTAEAVVNATFAVRMGAYANRDDCAASSIQAILPGPVPSSTPSAEPQFGNGTGNATTGDGAGLASSFGASVVLWAYQNSVAMRVSGGGLVDHTADPAPEDASGQVPVVVDGSFGARLPAGTVLVVEMGGHTEAYAHSRFQDPDNGFQFTPNEHRLDVVVTGSSTIVREEPRMVRCGEGTAQAAGHTALVAGSVVQGSIGGTVELAGANAGTMIVLTRPLTDTPREVTATFGEDAVGYVDVRRTADEPVAMGLSFGTWSTAYPSYYWFLADAYWPALEQTA